jgi:4-hydroxybenzoate polyprenyltransferase
MRERSRDGCFQAFLNNQWVGLAVFAGLLVDYLV